MPDTSPPRPADPTRAALLLVAGMLAWQLGVERTPSRWTPCLEPRSTQRVDGASRAVVCNAAAVGGNRSGFGAAVDPQALRRGSGSTPEESERLDRAVDTVRSRRATAIDRQEAD